MFQPDPRPALPGQPGPREQLLARALGSVFWVVLVLLSCTAATALSAFALA